MQVCMASKKVHNIMYKVDNLNYNFLTRWRKQRNYVSADNISGKVASNEDHYNANVSNDQWRS